MLSPQILAYQSPMALPQSDGAAESRPVKEKPVESGVSFADVAAGTAGGESLPGSHREIAQRTAQLVSSGVLNDASVVGAEPRDRNGGGVVAPPAEGASTTRPPRAEVGAGAVAPVERPAGADPPAGTERPTERREPGAGAVPGAASAEQRMAAVREKHPSLFEGAREPEALMRSATSLVSGLEGTKDPAERARLFQSGMQEFHGKNPEDSWRLVRAINSGLQANPGSDMKTSMRDDMAILSYNENAQSDRRNELIASTLIPGPSDSVGQADRLPYDAARKMAGPLDAAEAGMSPEQLARFREAAPLALDRQLEHNLPNGVANFDARRPPTKPVSDAVQAQMLQMEFGRELPPGVDTKQLMTDAVRAGKTLAFTRPTQMADVFPQQFDRLAEGHPGVPGETLAKMMASAANHAAKTKDFSVAIDGDQAFLRNAGAGWQYNSRGTAGAAYVGDPSDRVARAAFDATRQISRGLEPSISEYNRSSGYTSPDPFIDRALSFLPYTRKPRP